jgi:hypothetical protein
MNMFENLSITVTTILAIFGGITVIFNGISIIKGLFKPAKDVHETLEKHERAIKMERKKLESVQDEMKITLKCLSALMGCDAPDGDESLKEAREALTRFLIDR